MEASKRTNRITVLLSDNEMSRLEHYCDQQGFKKSTLLARLVREHLDSEGFPINRELDLRHEEPRKQ